MLHDKFMLLNNFLIKFNVIVNECSYWYILMSSSNITWCPGWLLMLPVPSVRLDIIIKRILETNVSLELGYLWPLKNGQKMWWFLLWKKKMIRLKVIWRTFDNKYHWKLFWLMKTFVYIGLLLIRCVSK